MTVLSTVIILLCSNKNKNKFQIMKYHCLCYFSCYSSLMSTGHFHINVKCSRE